VPVNPYMQCAVRIVSKRVDACFQDSYKKVCGKSRASARQKKILTLTSPGLASGRGHGRAPGTWVDKARTRASAHDRDGVASASHASRSMTRSNIERPEIGRRRVGALRTSISAPVDRVALRTGDVTRPARPQWNRKIHAGG